MKFSMIQYKSISHNHYSEISSSSFLDLLIISIHINIILDKFIYYILPQCLLFHSLLLYL